MLIVNAMENFLEYVVYALLGYSYEVSPRDLSCDGKTSQWGVRFEDRIILIFDENDVKVLRFMLDVSKDAELVARISKLLTYFV